MCLSTVSCVMLLSTKYTEFFYRLYYFGSMTKVLLRKFWVKETLWVLSFYYFLCGYCNGSVYSAQNFGWQLKFAPFPPRHLKESQECDLDHS